MEEVSLKLDEKSFRPLVKKLEWPIVYLDVAYKAAKGLDGVFIRKSWQKIAKYPRVENRVKTTDGGRWRWGLREVIAGVIILLPEPGSKKEISIHVEDMVDENLVRDSVESLLLELGKEFNATLPKKYRNALRSPQ